MSEKSEIPGATPISATEASRAFSELLDRVEKGQSFTVHRHGRPVCVIHAPVIARRNASECLSLLRARPAVLLDDKFGDDLLGIISEPPEERPSWES
jgi:antitoxin (DNA-binding transcriptional repressor) of toxin-antitoxin stability system